MKMIQLLTNVRDVLRAQLTDVPAHFTVSDVLKAVEAKIIEAVKPQPRTGHMTVEEFEGLTDSILPFRHTYIFAKYKGNWKECHVTLKGDTVFYFFYHNQANRMMKECISDVFVPVRPEGV